MEDDGFGSQVANNAGAGMGASELKRLSPEELFRTFDTDLSGTIDVSEFKVMLDKLGIKMAPPKALKYFKMCDQDRSGAISLEEFKVALFATDPVNGNEIGFSPTNLLAPMDVFEMFDEDGSGSIDEDEFAFIMEYMRVPLTEERLEQLFHQADRDGTGAIEYEAFKQVWLKVCDVAKELEDRGVEVPKFSTHRQRQKMLEKLLEEEEEAERHAMAEAERYREWQKILAAKRVHLSAARRRARKELAAALDAAGQVYVFGTGSLGQFHGPVKEPRDAKGAKLIRKLWKRRVRAARDDLRSSAAAFELGGASTALVAAQGGGPGGTPSRRPGTRTSTRTRRRRWRRSSSGRCSATWWWRTTRARCGGSASPRWRWRRR